MKNFIMGVSMIALCTLFVVFQNDINLMQRQQNFVYNVAEEAAATAALYCEEGDEGLSFEIQNFANGFIKFKDDIAAQKGMEVVKKSLALDASLRSGSAYFKDEITVVIMTFSQDEKYCVYVNGQKKVSNAAYRRGENLSDYAPEPYAERLKSYSAKKQININYPSTVCIIDTGKPRFTGLLNLNTEKASICKVGTYEYKFFKGAAD